MNVLENKVPPPLIALLAAAMLADSAGRARDSVDDAVRLALAGVSGCLVRSYWPERVSAFAGLNMNGSLPPESIPCRLSLRTTSTLSRTRCILGARCFSSGVGRLPGCPLDFGLARCSAFVLFITKFSDHSVGTCPSSSFGDAYGAYQATGAPLA